jgi:hypothetical protein
MELERLKRDAETVARGLRGIEPSYAASVLREAAWLLDQEAESPIPKGRRPIDKEDRRYGLLYGVSCSPGPLKGPADIKRLGLERSAEHVPTAHRVHGRG